MDDSSNALNLAYIGHETFTPPGFNLLQLRGAQMPAEPYVACVGGSHVFGRFCQHPWPSLLGVPTLNLGIGDASPATFLDERLLRFINDAEAVIVCMMTARNQGEWRPNADGLKGNRTMDGRTFDDQWRERLKSNADELVASVHRARNSWKSDLRMLLGEIEAPTKLIYVSERLSAYQLPDPIETLHQLYGLYPHLVTHRMLPSGTHEIVLSFGGGGYYPGSRAHERIAECVRELVHLEVA